MNKVTLNAFHPQHLERLTENDLTAFTFDDLQLMASILYSDFPEEPRLDPSSDANFSKRGLFQNLSQVFNDLPQTLWFSELNQPYVRSFQRLHMAVIMEAKYFKPRLDAPFDTILLSAENINNALNGVFPSEGNFLYLGAARPKEVQQVFHRLTTSREPDDFRPFGLVLNTSDRGGGHHWVALMYFPAASMCEYFDPMNMPPNALVAEFTTNFGKLTANYCGVNPRSLWDTPDAKTKRHQKGDEQCGMFCIWYMVQRMRLGRTMEEVHASRASDTQMKRERKKYFRPFEDELLHARSLESAPLIESMCHDEAKEVEQSCLDAGRTAKACAERSAKAKEACVERETKLLGRTGRKKKAATKKK